MAKRLALDINGNMTYCSVAPGEEGKKGCTHKLHIPEGVSTESFAESISNSVDLSDAYDSSKGAIHINGVTRKFIKDGKFIKIDSDLSGHEGVREEFASMVAIKIGLEDAVEYRSSVYSYDGDYLIGVESDDFKRPGEVEITFGDIPSDRVIEPDEDWDSDDEYFLQNTDWKMLKSQIDTFQGLSGKDLSKDILKLAAFDMLIDNADRINNPGNIGVLYNEETDEYRMIPPFDFGMSSPSEEESEFISDEELEERAASFKVFIRDHYGIRKPILQLNPDEIKSAVELYDNALYSKSEVEHIKSRFMKNLKMTEGILWSRA